MSCKLASLVKPNAAPKTRAQILALVKAPVYDDGMTKQCHKDECDIEKIMARFDVSGTISHLSKYEPVYADFSDFDFQTQTQMLTRGREIFDALPAELRQEFGQSPEKFFKYVNDPANADDLRNKLPALAKPGRQLPQTSPPTADVEKAAKAAEQPVADPKPKADDPPKPAETAP